MMQGQGSTDSRLEINLTPLLDLVLQLIMFFMLTVNFVRVDQFGVRVDLPVVQSAMALASGAENTVTINIDQSGQRIAGGEKLRTASQLRTYIETRKEEFDRLLRDRGLKQTAYVRIVIRAHKESSWGDVWDTLDLCSRAGYRSWQLRVVKKGG
jgi:biopolymer transport protein ExbD